MMRAMSRAARQPAEETTVKIGFRLRRARRQRGMTIERVAEATGLSKGFISQLERDGTSASVASLVRICNALGIRVGSLFDPLRTDLVRRVDQPRINLGGTGVVDLLLTPTAESRFEVIESHVDPGGSGGEELYSLAADAEFVYILRGTLEVRVGGERYLLEVGDALTFPAREPHTWTNPSKEELAVALWVIAPPAY